jgi:prolyl-tRNA synthetase
VEVLFDDREVSPGEKFADSDLIGIPMRVVVSDKSIEKGGVEIKERLSSDSQIVSVEELLATYKKNC